MIIKQIPIPYSVNKWSYFYKESDFPHGWRTDFTMSVHPNYNGEGYKEDIKNLEEQNVEIVFYWYEDEGYSGHGYAMIKCYNEDEWYIDDLGHSSCGWYGFKDFKQEKNSKSFKYNLKGISKQVDKKYWNEIKGLVKEAKKFVKNIKKLKGEYYDN